MVKVVEWPFKVTDLTPRDIFAILPTLNKFVEYDAQFCAS